MKRMMKKLYLLSEFIAFFLIISRVAAKQPEHFEDLFQQFILKHNKTYAKLGMEYSYRLKVFKVG